MGVDEGYVGELGTVGDELRGAVEDRRPARRVNITSEDALEAGAFGMVGGAKNDESLLCPGLSFFALAALVDGGASLRFAGFAELEEGSGESVFGGAGIGSSRGGGVGVGVGSGEEIGACEDVTSTLDASFPKKDDNIVCFPEYSFQYFAAKRGASRFSPSNCMASSNRRTVPSANVISSCKSM